MHAILKVKSILWSLCLKAYFTVELWCLMVLLGVNGDLLEGFTTEKGHNLRYERLVCARFRLGLGPRLGPREKACRTKDFLEMVQKRPKTEHFYRNEGHPHALSSIL